MRKLLTLFSIVFFLAVASVPKAFSQVELFGGYSHLGLNGAPSGIGSSSNGWEGSAYLHLLGPWGAEADLSDHYGVSPRLPTNGSTFYVPQFMALYGPRFTLALPKFHPYVHALFGTVHGEAIVPAGDAVAKVSENAFGMGLGGGVNVSVSRHLWLRLIQVDYIRAQFNPNSQNETRISAGLVFRFGNW
ncbi:MAG: porin family protein [Acidobacteria bacterium]|nr:porin family protein [Acidobacteriota bacterium]